MESLYQGCYSIGDLHLIEMSDDSALTFRLQRAAASTRESMANALWDL